MIPGGRQVTHCFPKTTYIILHGLFGGVELLVVGAAAGLVDESEGRQKEAGEKEAEDRRYSETG